MPGFFFLPAVLPCFRTSSGGHRARRPLRSRGRTPGSLSGNCQLGFPGCSLAAHFSLIFKQKQQGHPCCFSALQQTGFPCQHPFSALTQQNLCYFVAFDGSKQSKTDFSTFCSPDRNYSRRIVTKPIQACVMTGKNNLSSAIASSDFPK